MHRLQERLAYRDQRQAGQRRLRMDTSNCTSQKGQFRNITRVAEPKDGDPENEFWA